MFNLTKNLVYPGSHLNRYFRTMVESFPFLGKWKGEGIVYESNVRYEEELDISLFGTPRGKQLIFSSKTWAHGKSYEENPMHTEIGMIRVLPQNENETNIELMLSHPFGMVEIESGNYSNGVISVQTSAMSRAPSSSNNVVTNVRRRMWIENNQLKYHLFLTLVDKPEYFHLDAALNRIIQ